MILVTCAFDLGRTSIRRGSSKRPMGLLINFARAALEGLLPTKTTWVQEEGRNQIGGIPTRLVGGKQASPVLGNTSSRCCL